MTMRIHIIIIEPNSSAAEWIQEGLVKTFSSEAEFIILEKVPEGVIQTDIVFISAKVLREHGCRLTLSRGGKVIAMSNEPAILGEANDKKLADGYVKKENVYYSTIPKEQYFN